MRKNDEQFLREDGAWQHDDDLRDDDLAKVEEKNEYGGTERLRWADTNGADDIDDDLLRLWNHSTSSSSAAHRTTVGCTFHR